MFHIWGNMSIQLDFFLTPEECEMEAIRRDQNKIRSILEKVRKGTYSEINQLKKVCAELSARQDIIERSICLGK